MRSSLYSSRSTKPSASVRDGGDARLSAPEIAAELAIPVNTVYSRLRLARKRLSTIAGSDQALMAEVEKTRRVEKPTRKEQERTYAALMPVLGSQWLPYKTALLATAKSAALPAIALVIALTSYAVTVATNEGETEEDATEEVAEPSRSRDRPYGPPPPKQLTGGGGGAQARRGRAGGNGSCGDARADPRGSRCPGHAGRDWCDAAGGGTCRSACQRSVGRGCADRCRQGCPRSPGTLGRH